MDRFLFFHKTDLCFSFKLMIDIERVIYEDTQDY